MARPRSYRTEALVLRSTPVGEAGAIVTLFSENEGKLRAIAHGVRKPTSKKTGHLEPLNRVDLALSRPSSGALATITQAQMIEGFDRLKGDLEALSKGIYLAELADGFGAEGSANRKLYSLLLDTLGALNDTPGPGLVLRYFELHLLRCAGFMPELYRCVECREELRPDEHLFSPDVGGTLCLGCTPSGVRVMSLSVQALKVMRFLHRATLGELARLRTDIRLEEELKSLLSVALKYWLDREIQSKSFLEHLERHAPIEEYIRGA